MYSIKVAGKLPKILNMNMNKQTRQIFMESFLFFFTYSSLFLLSLSFSLSLSLFFRLFTSLYFGHYAPCSCPFPWSFFLSLSSRFFPLSHLITLLSFFSLSFHVSLPSPITFFNFDGYWGFSQNLIHLSIIVCGIRPSHKRLDSVITPRLCQMTERIQLVHRSESQNAKMPAHRAIYVHMPERARTLFKYVHILIYIYGYMHMFGDVYTCKH